MDLHPAVLNLEKAHEYWVVKLFRLCQELCDLAWHEREALLQCNFKLLAKELELKRSCLEAILVVVDDLGFSSTPDCPAGSVVWVAKLAPASQSPNGHARQLYTGVQAYLPVLRDLVNGNHSLAVAAIQQNADYRRRLSHQPESASPSDFNPAMPLTSLGEVIRLFEAQEAMLSVAVGSNQRLLELFETLQECSLRLENP